MTTTRAIQQWLIDTGNVTETGLTRTPRQRPCRQCGHRTLAAIDDCGFDAITWGWPTTALGELTGIAAGRHSWHVGIYGGLVLRGAGAIAHKPPGRVDVHLEHRCTDTPPPPAPSVQPTPTRRTSHDQPPF